MVAIARKKKVSQPAWQGRSLGYDWLAYVRLSKWGYVTEFLRVSIEHRFVELWTLLMQKERIAWRTIAVRGCRSFTYSSVLSLLWTRTQTARTQQQHYTCTLIAAPDSAVTGRLVARWFEHSILNYILYHPQHAPSSFDPSFHRCGYLWQCLRGDILLSKRFSTRFASGSGIWFGSSREYASENVIFGEGKWSEPCSSTKESRRGSPWAREWRTNGMVPTLAAEKQGQGPAEADRLDTGALTSTNWTLWRYSFSLDATHTWRLTLSTWSTLLYKRCIVCTIHTLSPFALFINYYLTHPYAHIISTTS